MTRLQRKTRVIDDLLYPETNHVTVKEELGQYPDILKLLSTYHETYCELGLMTWTKMGFTINTKFTIG